MCPRAVQLGGGGGEQGGQQAGGNGAAREREREREREGEEGCRCVAERLYPSVSAKGIIPRALSNPFGILSACAGGRACFTSPAPPRPAATERELCCRFDESPSIPFHPPAAAAGPRHAAPSPLAQCCARALRIRAVSALAYSLSLARSFTRTLLLALLLALSLTLLISRSLSYSRSRWPESERQRAS